MVSLCATRREAMALRANDFRYFISQACRSFVRNGLMSITSIFTVLCCMLILGLFLIISINVNYIANQIQDQCQIQAFIDEKTSDSQLSLIKTQLEALDNVSSAELFTKEDSLEYMREMFAENADALDGLEDDNPFRDSYKISLKDLSLATQTIEQIKTVTGVADVENKQAMMDNVLNVTNTIKHLSFWIMLILGLVSIFIISNTIKLALYARRKEINVMKFVGATNWFIRWPFVFEGIIIGIIGAVIAFALISWGYVIALGWVSGFNLDMFSFKTYGDIWWILLSCFIGIGAFIGAAGSGISIRKHLDV